MSLSLTMPDLLSNKPAAAIVPVFSFQICGLPISLTTSSASLLQLYSDYFRYYRTPLPREADPATIPLKLHLTLTPSLPAQEKLIPTDAEFIAQSGRVSFWRGQKRGREQFFFQTDITFFRVEPARGQAIGFISAAALQSPHLLANTYTFVILLLLLRWHGRYHLHTAAVISPRESLYLICGAPRAGKSTLTTALAVSGWQAISDDGILLQATEQGQAAAYAFKRDFHIAAELLRKWKGLRQAVSRHNYFDRACVDALDLFQTKSLAELPLTRATRVIFPEITGAAKSRLEPLPPSEAIHRLIEQSMFFPLWREHTQKQMSLLAAFVKEASFLRLLAGTDIWENPACAGELLAE